MPKNLALKHRLTKHPKLTGLLIVIILIGLSGLGYYHFSQTTSKAPQYLTATVTKNTLVVSINVAGQVSNANSASVTTNATGVVSQVLVKNGQTVRAGQAIAKIDLDQTSQQKYSQALASYQSAKTGLASAQTALYSLQADMLGKWDDHKQLAESDLYKDPTSINRSLPEFYISSNQWLAAEATYKQQQAVIAQAQTSLNSAWLALQQVSPTISAPIAGTMTGLSLQTGSVITSGSANDGTATAQKIASVTTTALPTVSITLTEIDVTKVKVGNKATITVDALGDKTFTGTIISVDTVGSVSSGVTSYQAVIALDTAVDGLYPNMSVQAGIITATKDNALLVPKSAIQTSNGQSTVKVRTDGEIKSVSVETGLSSDTQIEIVAGLAEGDEIITGTPLSPSSVMSTTQTKNTFGGTTRGMGFSPAGAAMGGEVRIITR